MDSHNKTIISLRRLFYYLSMASFEICPKQVDCFYVVLHCGMSGRSLLSQRAFDAITDIETERNQKTNN
jgi:hypothetical protein